MRLRELRISGFRAAPSCAHVEMVGGGRGRYNAAVLVDRCIASTTAYQWRGAPAR